MAKYPTEKEAREWWPIGLTRPHAVYWNQPDATRESFQDGAEYLKAYPDEELELVRAVKKALLNGRPVPQISDDMRLPRKYVSRILVDAGKSFKEEYYNKVWKIVEPLLTRGISYATIERRTHFDRLAVLRAKEYHFDISAQ